LLWMMRCRGVGVRACRRRVGITCRGLLWMSIPTVMVLLTILIRLRALVRHTERRTGRVAMHLGLSLALGVRMSIIWRSRSCLGRLVSPTRIIRPTWVVLMSLFETRPPSSRPTLVPTPGTTVVISRSPTCTTCILISCTTATPERTLWLVRRCGAPKIRVLVVIVDSVVHPTHARRSGRIRRRRGRQCLWTCPSCHRTRASGGSRACT